MGKDNSHLLLGEKIDEGPHGIVHKHVNDKLATESFLCFTKEQPHQFIKRCYYIEDALAWCGQVLGRVVDKGVDGFVTKVYHTFLGVTHRDANYFCYTNDKQPRLLCITSTLHQARSHCGCKSASEKSNATSS